MWTELAATKLEVEGSRSYLPVPDFAVSFFQLPTKLYVRASYLQLADMALPGTHHGAHAPCKSLPAPVHVLHALVLHAQVLSACPTGRRSVFVLLSDHGAALPSLATL